MRRSTWTICLLVIWASAASAVGQQTESGKAFRPRALGMTPPILSTYEELDLHIGELVVVLGTLSNTKIPKVVGVRVSDPNELRGEEVYAVGILAKWIVTEEQLRNTIEAKGSFANDGPGVKFILYTTLTGELAAARRWPESDDASVTGAKDGTIQSKSNLDYERLVDATAQRPADVHLVKGRSTYRVEGTDRINDARRQLVDAGKPAWPTLIKHLNDKRPAMATRSITGPHTVGMYCEAILRAQITDFPRGYPRSKLNVGNHLVLRPSLEEWLQARSHRPIEQIRIEFLQLVIDAEDAVNHERDQGWSDIRDRLGRHLETLKSRARSKR